MAGVVKQSRVLGKGNAALSAQQYEKVNKISKMLMFLPYPR